MVVDDQLIKKWLKEGTINQVQAKKMLADISQEKSADKSNRFLSVVAIIGAVLIFIGFAWLIAKNWHQIPSVIKVIILVFVTLAAFVSGVFSREHNHEGIGRSLIALGALLYILSVFLIAQIYATPSGLQGYAWLLILCWPLVMLTAYLLDSKEDLIIGAIVFFPWAVVQYLASIDPMHNSSEEGILIGMIILFLSAGVLLFGLSTYHNSIKHRFTNVYRFFTVLYFTLIFYIISFQSSLSILSGYSIEIRFFSAFLITFIIICFLSFVISSIFAVRNQSISLKEILVFLGILTLLLILILSAKSGMNTNGDCSIKYCYNFATPSECASAHETLNCEWDSNPSYFNGGYCNQIGCYSFKNEIECNSDAAKKLGCGWQKGYNDEMGCQRKECNEIIDKEKCEAKITPKCGWHQDGYCITELETECNKYDNNKISCTQNSLCNWQPAIYGFMHSKDLPTGIFALWIIINFLLIGFIILILWYGQNIGSTKIVNLALFAFILDIVSRYIGFWMDLQGYFAFSVLAILGGLMLIFGTWLIPRLRKKLLDKTKKSKRNN